MGSRDMNSASHACNASAFPTEPSAQFYFEKKNPEKPGPVAQQWNSGQGKHELDRPAPQSQTKILILSG